MYILLKSTVKFYQVRNVYGPMGQVLDYSVQSLTRSLDRSLIQTATDSPTRRLNLLDIHPSVHPPTRPVLIYVTQFIAIYRYIVLGCGIVQLKHFVYLF